MPEIDSVRRAATEDTGSAITAKVKASSNIRRLGARRLNGGTSGHRLLHRTYWCSSAVLMACAVCHGAVGSSGAVWVSTWGSIVAGSAAGSGSTW